MRPAGVFGQLKTYSFFPSPLSLLLSGWLQASERALSSPSPHCVVLLPRLPGDFLYPLLLVRSSSLLSRPTTLSLNRKRKTSSFKLSLGIPELTPFSLDHVTCPVSPYTALSCWSLSTCLVSLLNWVLPRWICWLSHLGILCISPSIVPGVY